MMIAYMVQMGSWHGLMVAKNRRDMYWLIDEFGDPNDCLICNVTNCGVMVTADDFNNESSDVSEQWVDAIENGKWVSPKWTAAERL